MSHNLHSSARSSLSSFSLKTLSAAVLSTLLCSAAYAAGLGKLTVMSGLGQPLRAEVELNAVSREEAGSIIAKLASAESFRQANIEFNPALYALRFAIENRGDRYFIRITSSQPINEPFVDMLVELTGSGNRMLREYTFLLDPPELRSTQSTQVAATATAGAESVKAAPVPQPSMSETPVASSSATSTRATPEKKSRKAAAQSAAASDTVPPPSRPAKTAGGSVSGTYEVKKGDTLAKIASQARPEGVSLDQMLVALYRANPSAFIDNNMNRLRAGQILSVPDADAARAISGADARGVIVAQAADFNTYRNKLAGQVASAVPQKAAVSKQATSGKITTKVEEKASAANDSKDKLKLSKAGAASAASDKNAGMNVGTEDKIAREKALAEANARVKELERNVNELQQLLAVKNKTLEEQQKQAQLAKQASQAASAPVASKPAASTVAASIPAASAPVASAPAASVPAASAPAPAASAPVASVPAASAPAPAKPPVAAAPPKPAAPPPPEPGFLEDLLGNTVVMLALAFGLLAGVGGIAWKLRSRKRQQDEKFDDSLLEGSSLRANSLFGSTGGQSVDTNNSVFNSSFAASASQLDTNEVDPVAEADVYIAYGRDAQAEEILKEALRTQPERNAVRLKLLEIYANRKDLRAFEVLATELYSLTKGEGEDWAQAVSMGLALDPSNPLYGGAAGAAAPLAAPTQPMDDGSDLDALLETTQDQPGPDDTLGNDATYLGGTLVASDVAAEAPELPVESEAVPELQAESASADSLMASLDFDLEGLGPNSTQANVTAEPEVNAVDLDFGSLDFSGVQADAGEAVPMENTLAPATTMSVDIGTDDLSFMPQEAPEPELSAESAPAAEVATDANALNFDLSDISLDLDPSDGGDESVPDLAATASVAAVESDNLLPDLDLPQEDIEMAPDLVMEPESEITADSEMATKLDLAIAYQEIGDKEGARELLDEVIKGGSPDQSEKARSLLVSMA